MLLKNFQIKKHLPKDFIRETVIMLHLNHMNVLKLYGYFQYIEKIEKLKCIFKIELIIYIKGKQLI